MDRAEISAPWVVCFLARIIDKILRYSGSLFLMSYTKVILITHFFYGMGVFDNFIFGVWYYCHLQVIYFA